jgi:hypothetical protein
MITTLALHRKDAASMETFTESKRLSPLFKNKPAKNQTATSWQKFS